MKTALLLGQDQLGHGDRALGQKVLGTLLRKAQGTLPGLEAIAFYNAGVKLVAKDSPVLPELTRLHEQGIELMPCGTCLQAYGIEPVVGRVSDMDSILRELGRAEKVITL
jgi:hypothetical protein